MTRRAGPVLFDLQATQSIDQRYRGIPRYALEQALALEENVPGAVSGYLLNPDRPLPEAAERLVSTGKLCFPDDVDWEAVGLLHVASPMEMTVRPHRQVPLAARRADVPRVVTLYDLIPELNPDDYLEDPGNRRRYRARLQDMRTVTAVLTLSEATRGDAIEHLALDPRRVFVVGSGTGPRFVPPASRSEAAAAAAAAVPGLRPPFVFYIGSYEQRKNLEPLLEAWSLLPAAVRGHWQLAVCCPLQRPQLHHLRYRARQMGVSEAEVCFTGFVPDEVLLLLHQGTELFVFPSLYEGYGLPVAEALACGAAVLAANSSSLPEIVGPEALFDASDPGAMAAAIERGLTDEGLRGRLLGVAGRPPSTWAEVATATAAVYERVLSGELSAPTSGRSGAGRARPRLALAAPLPPDGGPWGAWSYRLAEELSGQADVEVFADRPVGADRQLRQPQAPPGVRVHPLAALAAVESLEGAFDSMVYVLGDDEFHTGALAALRRRAGVEGRNVVVAHDAHLSDLYGYAARAGGLPEGLAELIRSVYGAGVEPGVGEGNVLPPGEGRRRGILLARDAVACSGRFLVTSEAGAALARLDAAPADRAKIAAVAGDPAGVADALYSELIGRRPAGPAPTVPATSGTPRTPGTSGTPRTPGTSGTPRTPDISGTPRTPGTSGTPRTGRVVVDLQTTQNASQRHRGISRYAMGLVLALEETSPGAVDSYVLNPDLTLPEAAERLVATGKLRYSDEVDWAEVGLLHTVSLFEMEERLHRLLPPGARDEGVPWVITCHDLIPYLYPQYYLEDPGLRRRYGARLQDMRTATAVLTNSAATRSDLIEHLGLDPRRVFFVGSGTGPQFVPPVSRSEAAAAAAAAVPGLQPPYVFYIGGYEPRKNVETLLQAWSLLPPAVRTRWQLAVSCPLRPLQRRHLEFRAAHWGVSAEVFFTGFVPDEVLLLLHQGTDLFVFPSLYEGYGLPVAEAMACGAAVLAADSSSLPEIVGPEALFDPSDPGAMAAAIERGLTDEGLRRRLLGAAGRPPSTWAKAAAGTAAVYERVLAGGLGIRGVPEELRARGGGVAAAAPGLRTALVAPWPPDGGPWGEWAYRLAEELSGRLEVEVFADRPVAADRRVRALAGPPGVVVHPLAALQAVEALAGTFDSVVYLLADDEFHTGALAALRRRAGGRGRSIVVAHDVRLSDLYGSAARSGGLPEGLEELICSVYGETVEWIRTVYGEGVEPGVGKRNVLSADEARRRGILLARDAVACSGRFLVTSEAGAALARLDAVPADRDKIAAVAGDPVGVADALYSELTAG